MNLIVEASLSAPPSESLSFRYLTMVAKDNLNFDCLLEVEQAMKDIYYHYLLHRGMLDFIDQLITPPEAVPGLRLSEHPTYRPMIELRAIHTENCVQLLGCLRTWAKLAQ